jgi:putative Ca2+/H+ antiporter (TMEM165/GDT1 family)
MNTSIIISQILGITFTVMGLSLLVNKKETTAFIDEVMRNKAVMWILGFITTILGATIVVFNNLWTSGLELFITIIGWLTLIKGIMILVFPNSSALYYKKINKENILVIGGLIIVILGLILLYAGFM